MTELLALIQSSSFYEFATLLTLAAVTGLIATALRQPLIIAFILVGIIAGPAATGVVSGGEELALLAKLGIAILLFIVGLKLDPHLIRSLGSVAITVGATQVSLSIAMGTGMALLFGLNMPSALLVGVALSFSSTIIIVKLLSDKKEIDSIHGRIALGVLIIQDLVVVLSMMVLATLSNGAEGSISDALSRLGLYSTILLLFILAFTRYAALPVMSFAAKIPELLLCFAIAWAVLLAALCDALGLSKELGGLLAGIALAGTPYREAIIARLASLRDFLLLFFFLALGTQIDITTIGGQIMPAIALSLFVMITKPVIIMLVVGQLGYRKRTGFLAGLSLAQISEFSLILTAMAYTIGLVEQDVLSLITLIALITIAASTYLLSLSHGVYMLFEPYLNIFERHDKQRNEQGKMKTPYDLILFGHGRYGRVIANRLIAENKKLLVIDFNPEEVQRITTHPYDIMFGDASDPDFYQNLPLQSAQWVVSALPEHDLGITHEDPRLVMIQALRDNNYKGKIAMAAHEETAVEPMKKAGANIVFLPFHDAGERAVNLLLDDH